MESPDMHIYMLSDNDEYGSEHIRATLDKSKLLDMFKSNWPDYEEDEFATLVEMVAREDFDAKVREGVAISRGWGGPRIQIVDLE